MSDLTPLTKELLNGYKNENQSNVFQRRNEIKSITQEIYCEIINLAIKGDTKYVFSLTNFCKNHSKNYNHRSNLLVNKTEYHMKYINELISAIYLILPDSNIQYIEKKIYDLQDRETTVPCIIIDWS